MAGANAGGFVTRAFESMLKECGNKKYSALHSAIKTYLDNGKDFNLQPNLGENNVSSYFASGAEVKIEGDTLGGQGVELVLDPLTLAFETKNVKIVDLALDCLHKLIEYNQLEGDPGLDAGKNSKLLTEILNMVCSCVGNSTPDSTTLQVLKVLLTTIASTKVRVHGEPLLEVIRVCSNIALNSKSPINQATSKSMLRQMLSIIFRHEETGGVSSDSPESKETNSEDMPNTIVDNGSSCGRIAPRMSMDNLLSVKQINKTFVTSAEGIQNIIGGTDIKRLEDILEKATRLEDTRKITSEMGLQTMNATLCDALIVFHTLCEMAVKEGKDELTSKTRLLVLDLLQGSLEDVGKLFKKNLPFIDSIRAHLSYALLRASLSQSPSLFQCAIGIFSALLVRFRESFKAEIGIFFPMIVLRSLDGPDLPPKLSVLRMLEKACMDPQMLVDLYINYDCDPDAPNIFERMVVALSKISQGTQNMDPKISAASQIGSIKTSSLQDLVNALKSLVIWEKSESQTGNKNMESSFEQVSPEKMNDTKTSEERTWNFGKEDTHESITEAVISEFNQNSVKGIQYLMSCQMVDNTPPSIAQFFRSTPNLNKAMIGNYLGQQEEFATSVMHSYVESMNFSGIKLHIALHHFLQGFRLPEEAQKIDRIMEKFAECYLANNPGLFKNADTVYVLAYAILMVLADGDNVTVPQRISRSDFIHLSKIYNGEDSVPDEILAEIYDVIKKQEINLKTDPSVTSVDYKEIDVELLINILNLSIHKRRYLNDAMPESEAIIKQIEIIMKDQNGNMGVFYTSRRIELLYPMVEILGWPILATFAVTMGEADRDLRISLCMEGFKEGIHLTHVLGMDTMRYAFLTSLLRYNFLHAPRDMREKNVEALRTLLDLCDTDINSLQNSWLAILKCISRLEYVVSWPPITATVMQGSNQVSRDSILQSLRELSGKPTAQVFMNSIKLPSESVVEFFTALCSVSAEELKQTPPRTFSLQKVVEISYDNMARIHMVWAKIWSVLSLHFVFAGGHTDEKVAMYAIDALRQLGMKYLERIELANFSFQNDILKPFAILMQRNSTETLRRLLLNSIVQIIKSKAGKLKSGWGSVFMIFTAAAEDDLELIVERAFENVEQVILEHFDQIITDCFMDCMNCLIGFAKNKRSDSISLKAIALLRICEHRVAEGIVSGGSPKPVDTSTDENLPVTERYWYAMLAGYSDMTSDPRSEVRNCALDVLFDLLNERGSKFSYSFWETIFQRVLFPIFDHIRRTGKETTASSGNEWLRESSVHALQLLCNLFNCFYKEVSFMLPQLLGLLLECAKKTDQSVASLSLGALMHLIEVGGHQFCDPDWDSLLKSIQDASYTAHPLELLNDLGFENRKYHPSSSKEIGSHSPVSGERSKSLNTNQVGPKHADIDGPDGMPSPSGGAARPTHDECLQRSQSLGQRIMGNVNENVLVRTFTSKPKNLMTDEVMPSSPPKGYDAREEEESPVLGPVRSKCITQLLLLGAVDLIQKKYWNKLSAQQKITLMEILFSVLELAASYNSNTNLRLRMQQLPTERAPLNLLRQELIGTGIYLDILQKTTSVIKEESVKEETVERVAVEKLVSFCEQFLREESNFLSRAEGMSNMEIHRVLELRSPVIVKVLNSMCIMNPHIFKTHLSAFYPSITKLICCDQMEVRSALADLFSMQFPALLQPDFTTV